MLIIEASRSVSRVFVDGVRAAFMEFDRVAFKDVDVPTESAYTVLQQGETFVLAVDDPSFEPLEADCGS